MSKVTDIRRLLAHIRLKLTQHLGAQGLTIEDPEFPRKIEELNSINRTLGISIRDLKSAQHSANVREQNLWKIPRDKRYGPASAVADQQKEIDELIREAAEIQRLVEDLIDRVIGGNEIEGVRTVAELIEKMSARESSNAEHAVPDRPAYVPYSPGHFQPSPESAVIMAYVALRALVLISKKIAAKLKS